MGRCLLGVFVLTAGLFALASVARKTRSSTPETASTGGHRLRAAGTIMISGTPRTLLLPAPTFDAGFSLN